jgi:hypothetical protein
VSTWLLLAVIILFSLLALHHFIKARRGLRTGTIEGLMIGFWGKRFSREQDLEAFRINVSVGFFVAALGASLVLWAIFVIIEAIMQSYGHAPL